MQKESLVGKKLKTYSVIKKLGDGACSIVYEGYNSVNKQRVAIKAISFNKIKQKPKLQELVQTQIKVLKSCKNDNVIKHIDSFMSDKHVFIVIQYCNEGDVQEYLDKKKRLKEEQATDFLKQILNGFKGLHEVKAMHRDFKLANLLIHNKVIKIADLGFAKQLDKNNFTNTQLGTGLTMAPEVLDRKPYGMQADIWSIGVVFYQMLYGTYPFVGRSDKEIRKKIQVRKIDYSNDVKISDDAKDFIQRCLTIDPKVRISWGQIYMHPLITKQDSMKYSLIVSKDKLIDNKNYYMKNDISAQQKFIYPQKQNFITQYGEQMKQMNEDQVKEESNLQLLKSENQQKHQKQKEILQYEQIMLKKRNSIMFMFKYFVPKIIPHLHKISANHSMSLFFICKRTIIQLQDFLSQIHQKQSEANSKSGLKYFLKSQNCAKLVDLLLDNIEMVKEQTRAYMQGFGNSLPIAVQKIDLTRWESSDIQKIMKHIMQSYWYQIAEKLPDFNGNEERTILEVLKALQFYYTTEDVDVEVFEVILETMGYKDYREEAIRKIYDSMVNAN